MDAEEDQSIRVLLSEYSQGNQSSLQELEPLIYEHLRHIARRQMSGEKSGHTLSPTALVNEALLRLLGAETPWQDRQHFLAIAARQMRHVLVEHARAHRRQRRGGADWQRVTLTDNIEDPAQETVDVLAIDEALNALTQFDPRKAEILDLILFGGMTAKEAAETLGISEPTVNRELRMARVWLRHQLQSSPK
ncbi:MAG TPA: ECF-type sigma factor [Bryobacteraceae bacterium]|nr:ECF-type sigma factor [Bryobacteraceae bacterium]